MHINAYLNFDGNCREAMEFYARCFGAKVTMMQTHADSPMASKTPPQWQEKIVHARLQIGDTTLMASDSPPEYFEKAQGFFISVQVDDVTEGDRIFRELSTGGAVRMPFQETFWAARFGMLVDRFGTPWMVNCALKE